MTKAEPGAQPAAGGDGEMAASLAHQLRTPPLATALLYSANLAKSDLAEDAPHAFCREGDRSNWAAGTSDQDVLLFARGEDIGREPSPSPSCLPMRRRLSTALRPACREISPKAGRGDVIIVGSLSVFPVHC